MSFFLVLGSLVPFRLRPVICYLHGLAEKTTSFKIVTSAVIKLMQ